MQRKVSLPASHPSLRFLGGSNITAEYIHICIYMILIVDIIHTVVNLLFVFLPYLVSPKFRTWSITGWSECSKNDGLVNGGGGGGG